MKKLFLVFSILTASITVMGQQPIPVKPRILISTDIGGTDPDDNQSMAHFLMYSEMYLLPPMDTEVNRIFWT